MKKLNLRTPQNKQIFLSAAWEKIPLILEENEKILSQYSFKILNQPFQTIRKRSRKNILREAFKFSSKFDSSLERKINFIPQFIIQTGHQPVFFHPGIWMKNILLDALLKSFHSDKYKCLGLNIILDNDVIKDLSLFLPVCSDSGHLKLEETDFFSASQGIPFEERPLPTLEQINKFTENISNKLKPLRNKKILTNFLNFSQCLENSFHFCNQNYNNSNFGEFLGMSRRFYESEINPIYLELPFSRICNSDEFLSFFLEIIKNIEVFSRIYNDRLDEYRKFFRIKNQANPCPNLEIKKNLIEAPFWIICNKGERRSLYILKEDNKVNLYNDFMGKILTFNKDDSELLKKLKFNLTEMGLKIRPKALLLTLYNRLFISDLFIHGLGGAKYDQVTDEIIKEFFKVEPPRFLTTSCTLLLDFKEASNTSNLKVFTLKKKIRDLEFNPERYLRELDLPEKEKIKITRLEKKKKELIKKIKNESLPKQKQKISEEIKNINKIIKEELFPLQLEWENEIKKLEGRINQSKIYNFREFPYFLFSASTLQGLLKANLSLSASNNGK